MLRALSPCRGPKETHMRFTQRTRGIVQAIAVILSLAVPLVIAISSADARIGGGGSSGSRGTRTFTGPAGPTTAAATAARSAPAEHVRGAGHARPDEPSLSPAGQPRRGGAGRGWCCPGRVLQ